MESMARERIDELLRFLPVFREPGKKWAEWQGGETRPDGVMTMPYPVYVKVVEEFYRFVAQSWWLDIGYNPQQAVKMVNDDSAIQNASLEEIKTMLTYCLRGERFYDGLWEALLESGKLVKILERLEALKAEMSFDVPA